MVPLTSYFVDQSNQCNGSSELQRFNPKNWVVFTHSFLQCSVGQQVLSVEQTPYHLQLPSDVETAEHPV